MRKPILGLAAIALAATMSAAAGRAVAIAEVGR